jgi:hypothetical protein
MMLFKKIKLVLYYFYSYLKTLQYLRKKPKNIVILITIPRSGSTWILDALRCHPKITYEPRRVVYRLLNLTGGRYPVDLVNKGDSIIGRLKSGDENMSFENSRFKWIKIKKYSLHQKIAISDNILKQISFSIEKIHPEFYNYNNHVLLKNVKKLNKKGTNVKFIYLIRDPKEAISSWLNYQNRNPHWNENRDNSKLINYYLENYCNIKDLAYKCNGPIFDYSTLMNNPELVLKSIYDFLWENNKTKETNNISIIKESLNITSRKEKLKSGTPFLGKLAGDPNLNKEEINLFFYKNKEELIKCQDVYNSLLNLCE